MKKVIRLCITAIIIVASCILPRVNLFAQTLSPKVLATGGGYATAGGVSLSFTVGETFNTTLQAGIMLTQGQQQPASATPDAVANPSLQTICSGKAITTIALTGNAGGTVYNWTRDNAATVTGMATSGTGNMSGVLTNTTNAPVTVTFTITPTVNNYPSAAITATVLVNPIPPTPAIIADGATTFCTGGSVSLTSSAASGNQWSNGETTQSIVVNTAGSYYVTVTGSGGCTAQSNAVQVTVTQPQTFYADADGDGYGDPAVTKQACNQPAGYVSNNNDCDDKNAAVNPATVWYLDADGDGYYTGSGVTRCTSPGTGYKMSGLAGGNDCNDNSAAVHPGAITCPVVPVQCYSSGGIYTIAPLQTSNDCGVTGVAYTITGATSRSGSGTDASGAFNAGTSTITWTVNHVNGNPGSCQTTVTINSLAKPVITPGGPTAFYTGGSVVLTAPPAAGYLWNTGENTQAIKVTASGSYTVSVTNGNGCSSPVSDPVSVTVLASLSVSSLDGDNRQLTNNSIRPYLQLNNESNAPVAYSTVTIRYWLTVEDFAPMTNLFIDWAQLGTSKVKMKYVKLGQPRAGAYGYIEYSFDASAGSLVAGSNSGPIQSRAAKSDYTNFNEADDYSYASSGTYTKNNKITAYQNGTLVWGTEPAAIAPVQGLKAYSQDMSSGASTNSISTYLKLNNEGNIPASYKDITLRYWFTADGSQPLNYYLDYAQLGNSNIKGKFVKLTSPAATADTYLELSFAAPDSLYPASSTGNIQQRMAKSDWSLFSQLNDHSYKAGTVMSANSRITVYMKGVLVYGTEPGNTIVSSKTVYEGAHAVMESTAKQEREVLSVTVLNNPVTGGNVAFIVRGAEGQRVQASLVDAQGKVISVLDIGKVSAAHSAHLPVSNSAAQQLFLRVSTAREAKTIQVMRAK